jgi:septal ring factor EnvC (AmiA/AmiB activator)
MTEKKTGRSPKYTEAQVIEGIEIAERNGDIPSGDSVKKAMCEELGVASGINAQSLDREVHRLLEERVRQRRNRLIGALPSATLEAAKEVGALVEAAMLNHMGEEHNQLRAINGKKLTEINVDLANQREQIRGLLCRIDTKDAEIADLEGERDDMKGRMELAAAEIVALKERLAGIEQEEDFRLRMVAIVKETLGQHGTAAV